MTASIAESTWLRLDYLPSVQLDIVWQHISGLATLLALATDAAVWPIALEIIDSMPPGSRLQVRDPRIRPGAPERRARSLLLSRPELDLEHLATWLTTYDKLRPIPSLVAAAIDPPVRMLEAGLLELAIAAEGLHRRLDPTASDQRISPHEVAAVRRAALSVVGDNDVLRQRIHDTLTHLPDLTYAARLQALLSRTYRVAPEVAGQDTNEWIRLVKKARNSFAHQLTNTTDAAAEPLWREMYVLTQSLRWLLTMTLLLEAGVDGDAIAYALAQHDRYQTFLAGSRRDIPTVYGSAIS
jgi:hypothetical protein